MERRDSVLETACDWVANTGGENPDWAGLTAWLEADPSHRIAFDTVALAEREAVLALPKVATREHPPRARRHQLLSLGVLAAGVATIALLTSRSTIPQKTAVSAELVYRNGSQAPRAFRLARGETVTLDSSSSLRASVDGTRAELLTGAAMFDVHHDARRKITVAVGNYEIADLGTRFEVVRGALRVSAAVAEGAVAVRPRGGGTGFRLVAGRRIDWIGAAVGDERATDPASIGSWAKGRLIYADAPLALVADDIARHLGRRVDLDPRAGGLRFSGVLTGRNGSALLAQLTALAPVAVTNVRDEIRIVPRGRA